VLDQYSGATRVIFILGDPIAQVKAPFALTREFERRGQDAIVVPLQLSPADVDAGILAVSRGKNVDGLIATIPHKFALAAQCATLSERARFLGAVNVARRTRDGSWHGDMLDGEGFADPLSRAGCEIGGNRALLVGAGGAGSAIALALLDRGVARLAVHDVDAARRGALIAKLESKFKGRIVAGSADPGDAGIVQCDAARDEARGSVAGRCGAADVTGLCRRRRHRAGNDAVPAGRAGKRLPDPDRVEMFHGNLGLMADFFAPAEGTG
jgi:shikimate dehydrogenase